MNRTMTRGISWTSDKTRGFQSATATAPMDVGTICVVLTEERTDVEVLGVLHYVAISDHAAGISLLDPVQLHERGFHVDLNPPRVSDKSTGRIERGGRRFRLAIKDGRMGLQGRVPTDRELAELEQVELTSNQPWSRKGFFEQNEFDFVARVNYEVDGSELDAVVPRGAGECVTLGVHNNDCEQVKCELNSEHFAWCSDEVLQLTAQHSTRFARQVKRDPMIHRMVRTWALMYPRIPGTLYTDTFSLADLIQEDGSVQHMLGQGVLSDTCSRFFQVFVHHPTSYMHVVLMEGKYDVPKAVEMALAVFGVPEEGLRSDCAKEVTHVNQGMRAISRRFGLKLSSSSPHNQHANRAERAGGTLKDMTKRVLHRSGAPLNATLFVILFCVNVHNRTTRQSKNLAVSVSPMQRLKGRVPDVSGFRMPFFQKIMVRTYQQNNSVRSPFPLEDREPGNYLGIAPAAGTELACYVLLANGEVIISEEIEIVESKVLEGAPPTRAKDVVPQRIVTGKERAEAKRKATEQRKSREAATKKIADVIQGQKRAERMQSRLADKEAGGRTPTHKTPNAHPRQNARETGGVLGAARVEHEPTENSNDPLMGGGNGDAAETSAAAAPAKREGPCEAHDTGHEGARTTTVDAQGYVVTTEHGETMMSSAEITDHRRDCPKSGQVMALGHSVKRVTAERDREELVLRVKELGGAMEHSPPWDFATDFPSTAIKYAATSIEEDERATACPEAARGNGV